MEQPLVSVVIPAYNGERKLGRCLDSLLIQTYRELQILVVDDGSTDGTAALAERYARRDARVTLLRKANGGASSARNAALPHCQGDYIRFVDCDDHMPADGMEILVRKAMENDSDLVIAAYILAFGSLRQVRDLGRREDTLPIEAFLGLYSRKANSFYFGALWNKLFRRTLIQEQAVRFDESLRWGEDFMFLNHYLAGARQVSFTTAPVYCYVKNASGLTVQQALDCVAHPLRNIRVKRRLFDGYRELYRQLGALEQYQSVLWKYLVRVTLSN